MSDPEEFVLAYAAGTPYEAHFVSGLIEREQIPVRMVGEKLSGGFGELPATVLQVELFVARKDLSRAREIVDAYEDRRQAGGPDYGEGIPWDCPACGETIDGSFEICWNCQAPRPEE